MPHHIRITSWPITLLKHVGVSLWLHFNIYRIVREHRLDKLNLHTGPGGVLLIRKPSIPVIVTCHHTYRQQCHFIKSQVWKRIFLPFETRTYHLATNIICVSEATKNALAEQYGISEQKITVVPNAVDTRTFYPLGTKKTPHSLLYVGRIDRRKGIEFLIRSMPFVREQIPDAHLTVGGKGSHLENMKGLVSRLDLERNVTFLGFVPDDQLNSLYNRAQCVVVPSIFEGFGITVIEALAAGTRVVGTDTDGIREILNSGDYGRLVPYGNHRALADAIIAELTNPGKAEELAPKYRLAHMMSRYREVLEETAH